MKPKVTIVIIGAMDSETEELYSLYAQDGSRWDPLKHSENRRRHYLPLSFKI